jgi:hypothetical protein
MNRAKHLEDLADALAALIRVLARDPECGWRDHFDRSLAQVRRLQTGGFTQPELNELSGSVMHVYGGHSSFNDYAPLMSDGQGGFKLIPGAERFSELAGAVHESALSLRAIGNAA